MRGDFARVTFDPIHHYTQVLQHQGRVNLEADWNEQGAIVLHLLRSLLVDIGGRAWRAGNGFALSWDAVDRSLTIGKGHFYVDGVLCENDQPAKFAEQPNLPLPAADPTPAQNQFSLVYLDAWERLVTVVEAPELREIALGGPDTTSRAQVVWQVRALDDTGMAGRIRDVDAALQTRLTWANLIKDTALAARITAERTTLQALATLLTSNLGNFQPDNAVVLLTADEECRPRMRAKARVTDTQADLCTISPESKFRGLENQLYRIEVHDPGVGDGKTASVKWSRENGSVVYPIAQIAGDDKSTSVTVAQIGADARLGLCTGDWVEIVDDDIELKREANPLARVAAADRGELTVTLEIAKPTLAFDRHPLLRRWDQHERVTKRGVIPITESGDSEDGWLQIEDGISVAFQPGGFYATGDHWVVSARVESGDIDPLTRRWQPPRGVVHHLAPLGIIRKTTLNITDCAKAIDPIAE